MIMTKKRMTYMALFLLAVIAVAIIGAFVLRSTIKPAEEASTGTNASTPKPNVLATEAEATASITNAQKARQMGDYTSAITSYQKARTYYENAGNVEKTADMDIAISLLESEKKNMPAQAEVQSVDVR